NQKCRGGFMGGDIAGIREKIPYIKDLGPTAVLLYPMFSNDRAPIPGAGIDYLSTGYRVANYSEIDRNFGSLSEFTSMISEFHKAPRLNVIVDLPIAMTGIEHPWFKNKGLQSHYRQWNAEHPDENVASEPMKLSDGRELDSSYGIPILDHTNASV